MSDRYELIKIEKLHWMFDIVIESYSIHPVGFHKELLLFLEEVLANHSQIDYYFASEYPYCFRNMSKIEPYLTKTLISAQEKTWLESLLNTKFGIADPYDLIEGAIQDLDYTELKGYMKRFPLVFHRYISDNKEYDNYKINKRC